jgi:hypothetical protein
MPFNTYLIGGADAIVQAKAIDTASFGLINRTLFGSFDIEVMDRPAQVSAGTPTWN